MSQDNRNIATRYDHTNEARLYEEWEQGGLFQPKDTGQPFAIIMPPPNVTGELHAGHALVYAIHDIVARFKRRLGYAVLMLPGADHAAIAVETLVSKKLQKDRRLNKRDIGRQEFLQEVENWIDFYLPQIKNDLRQLGVSCDWSRFRFTMDERSKAAVETAFVRLHKKGLIYRAQYLVNWDPKLQTAVSDDEVTYRSVVGKLYWIKYGPITVATSRPETKLGDTAIAVHPDDHRYKDFIGQEIEFLNELGQMQKLPVVGDRSVDPEFGTGALKVTPAHDPTDWALGERHNLERLQIIDQFGRITAPKTPYHGLSVAEARQKIVADLEERNLIEKITDYELRQPISERSEAIIEPLPSTQWFIKTTSVKEQSLAWVRKGEISFQPKSLEKIYFNWLKDLRDWCVSRQLWWGHRIPAYYTPDGEVHVLATDSTELKALKKKWGDQLTQDPDVLDTWFSSGLWPLTTLSWPDQEAADLQRFYPTGLVITASDILFFWIARMIMLSAALDQSPPFKTVYFHGLVLDEQGQKMSKSRGNVLDPKEAIERYGADTLKMCLVGGTAAGANQRFSEQKLLKYRNFVTKIWNASRFVALSPSGKPIEIAKLDTLEQKFFKQLSDLEEKNQRLLSKYQLSLALEELYEFFWHRFADQLLEHEKRAINEGSAERAEQAGWVMRQAIGRLLVLIEDFAPFVVGAIRKEMDLR